MKFAVAKLSNYPLPEGHNNESQSTYYSVRSYSITFVIY